jgi:hypothetical protein
MDVNISLLMSTTSFSINKRATFICTWIYNYFKKHKYDDDDEWKSQQLIKQYDDDVHNINWLYLPIGDLHYMINFLYLQV